MRNHRLTPFVLVCYDIRSVQQLRSSGGRTGRSSEALELPDFIHKPAEWF